MHYQNGREAKIGDQVIGSVFNNGGVLIAGTLVSLTPGTDSCSAMVGYLVTIKSKDGSLPSGNPKLHGRELHGATAVKVQGTEQHGTRGLWATTYLVQDYTECKNLLHAADAYLSAQPIIAVAIDYGDLIDQNKKAHEERRGQSGEGPDFEEGFIKAHDTIKELIAQAQEAYRLEPGAIIEQPPIDNAHVEEGCEQFKAEPTVE